MPTDFPEPVAPAIKRCGIFARSAYAGSPEIVACENTNPYGVGSGVDAAVM